MTERRIPYATLVLVMSTVVVSLGVNFQISGSLFGKINITELEPFGGFTYKHILDLELWRLVVSQLIHVKQYHMLYNALSLLALGCILERKIGSSVFLSIWFIAGSVGTFSSTFTVPEPWNLGTGGSQAIFSLSCCWADHVSKKRNCREIIAGCISFNNFTCVRFRSYFQRASSPKSWSCG